jgi:hypothetical protein
MPWLSNSQTPPKALMGLAITRLECLEAQEGVETCMPWLSNSKTPPYNTPKALMGLAGTGLTNLQ